VKKQDKPVKTVSEDIKTKNVDIEDVVSIAGLQYILFM